MQSLISIQTPEKIVFTYEIAEIGTRIAAFVVDMLVQSLLWILLLLLFFLTNEISFSSSSEFSYPYVFASFVLIIMFIFRWFYFVFFETVMAGQTPGKKAMRIRVIRNNGESLDLATIITRNFLRSIDGLPIIPMVGGFVALLNSKRMRLGDIAANTLVVKEMYYKLGLPDFEVKFSNSESGKTKLLLDTKLNENELYIIRRFLNEKSKLSLEKQNTIANQLALDVLKKLKINTTFEDPQNFLEQVYLLHAEKN
jgi:uncharacterized RDD family membrane protein YckC